MTNPSLALQIFFSLNLISRPNIKLVVFSSLFISFLNFKNSLSLRFSIKCLSMSYWLRFWTLSTSFSLVIAVSICCLCDLTFWRIFILALSHLKSSVNINSLESKLSLRSILDKSISVEFDQIKCNLHKSQQQKRIIIETKHYWLWRSKGLICDFSFNQV